jgi:hypothetical protein
MEARTPWHRILDLCLLDFFQGLNVSVESDKDMSEQQQLLDFLITCEVNAPLPRSLPDGFEPLSQFNLVTFKSHQDTLDAWTLDELIAHYIAVRKMTSKKAQIDGLLPEDLFHLYAIASRYPRNMEDQLRPQKPGVYEVHHGSRQIRVIVANQLPMEPQNALLHMFSANADLVRYGRAHFRMQSKETSTLMLRILRLNAKEDEAMRDWQAELQRIHDEEIEIMIRETPAEKLLKNIPTEKRLEGIPPEKLLQAVPDEKRLEGIPDEKRLEGIPDEKRLEGIPDEKRVQGMTVDQLLAALPPAVREELVRRVKANGSPKSEP